MEGSDRKPNPFSVFTRTQCTMYGQSFIEIGELHVGRFPR